MERLEGHTQSQFLFEENYLFCSGFFHKSVFQKKADSRIVDGNIIIQNGNAVAFLPRNTANPMLRRHSLFFCISHKS